MSTRPRRWLPLLALPLIATIPVLVFAIATTVYLTQEQQHSLEREIVYVARHSIQAGDSLLDERRAALERLSALVIDGEEERAAYQTGHILSSRADWRYIQIRRTDGSVLIAQAKPGQATPAIDEPVLDQDRSMMALVVIDAEQGPYLLLKIRSGAVPEHQVEVSAVLDLAPFSEVLSDQGHLDWTIALLDRERVIVGRSRAPGDFVGQRATPSLAEQIEAATENFFYALNQEGARVYTAFSTSPETGWTAAVGVPAHLVEGPVRRAQWAWGGGGLVAVLLAALLAWLLTRNMLERQAAERRAMQLEAARQSEARLADIAANFPGLIFRGVRHPDGAISYPYLSSAISNLVGTDGETFAQPAPVDRFIHELIVTEDQPTVHHAIQKSAEQVEPYHFEARFKRPDGTIGWLRSTASTHRGADGSVIWDGVALDITELKEAEGALTGQTEVLRTVNRISTQIASELDRDKLVQLVLDAGREVVRAEFGAFFYNLIDDKGESYTLYALSGAKHEDFAQFPMPRNTKIFGPTFRGEGIVRLEDVTQDPRYGQNSPYRGMPEGHLPVRSYLAAPVVSRTGDVLGGLFFGHPAPGVFDDAAEQALAGIAAQAAVALENAHLFKAAEDEIAHRKEVETQQRMLLAELNHRVKNTLAVVLAIAQQTARSSASVEQFTEVYLGRIMALAHAHTLLTDANWQSATLRDLVRGALEPYADLGSESIIVEGPEVSVPPKQTLALSLVFHELATNASKYGGLSAAGGRMHIQWMPTDDDTLRLDWQEHLPTGVRKPEREGFGSRLINLNVERELYGSFHREFTEDGFFAEIRLPWNRSMGAIASQDENGSEVTGDDEVGGDRNLEESA